MRSAKNDREFELLEALAEKPEARQVDIAAQLGVAVGTVNWHLKRFAAKGYIKVKRIGRWHWGYILTPKGMTQKARLTVAYIHSSMFLYREARTRSRALLNQVKQAGYREVVLEGEGELVDVYKLTCLEQGIHCKSSNGKKQEVPVLKVDGLEMVLAWPDENGGQID